MRQKGKKRKTRCSFAPKFSSHGRIKFCLFEEDRHVGRDEVATGMRHGNATRQGIAERRGETFHLFAEPAPWAAELGGGADGARTDGADGAGDVHVDVPV